MTRKYSTSCIHAATILNEAVKLGGTITTKDIGNSLKPPAGFNTGNKLWSMAEAGYFSKEKQGGTAFYTVSESGNEYLRNNIKSIQSPEDIEYVSPDGGVGGKREKSKPSEPLISSAANAVLDQIAPIIDRNTTLHTNIGDLLIKLHGLNLPEELPEVPQKESGLMEAISLIQIDNAELETILIKIKTQLEDIRNKANEQRESSNTQSS